MVPLGMAVKRGDEITAPSSREVRDSNQPQFTHKAVPPEIPVEKGVERAVVSLAGRSIHVSVTWWVDAPSSMAYYGALYALFDRYLWRNSFVRKLGLVRIPNLTGRWAGDLVT